MKLSIRSISKTYSNGVQALKNVNLTIEQGLFGLLGPNGAGKSTLMRILATIQSADEGSVYLDNVDIFKQKIKTRQLLGYLPQEFGVYPKISAEQMLNHIAQLKGVSQASERIELVNYLLQRVNLFRDKRKSLGSFSGGMKQRFGIAQALIGSPKLLIVDEPTAGLDPEERNRFYNLLCQLGENTIVILSTHIVEDVSTLCAKFAIISQGEVLSEAQPDEAIKDLEGLIYTKWIQENDIQRIKEKYKVISTQLKGGNLFVRIFSQVHPYDGFYPSAPNLEDFYFNSVATQTKLQPNTKLYL